MRVPPRPLSWAETWAVDGTGTIATRPAPATTLPRLRRERDASSMVFSCVMALLLLDVDVLEHRQEVGVVRMEVLHSGAGGKEAERGPERDHGRVGEHLLRGFEVEGGPLVMVGRLECFTAEILEGLVLVAAEPPGVLRD